jgi:hypothetical protein
MRIGRSLAVAALAAGLAVTPARAGNDEDGDLRGKIDEAFRELMERMRPALDDFLDTLKVLDGIDSLEYYQRPEILPNGDIIIRRRDDAPPLPPRDEPEPEAGVKT